MPSYDIKMAQHLLSENYVVATVCVAVCFPDAFEISLILVSDCLREAV